jgi:hypothetical protein
MSFPRAFRSRSFRVVAAALPFVAVLAACGGGGSTLTPPPKVYLTPTAATNSICIAASAQAQTVTLPSTGGVTGTLAVAPLSLQSGDCLHVTIASGADATLSLDSSTSSSSARRRSASSASVNYGAAVYQLLYTAKYIVNIVVPGATLNFGNNTVPDGSYVVILTGQGIAPQTITVTASGGVITYTGPASAVQLAPGQQVLLSFYPSAATPSPTPSVTSTPSVSPTMTASAAPTATETPSYAPSTPYPSSPPTHAPTATPTPTSKPTATPLPATCSATGEVWNFGGATQSCLGVSPGNIPILSPLDDGGNTFSFTFSAPWNSFGQPTGGILFQATSNFSSITVTNSSMYPLQALAPGAEYISLYGPTINGNGGGPVTITVQQTNSSLWSQSADSRCLLYYWDPQERYWAGWIASQFITNPTTISLTANLVANSPQEIYAFFCGN